MNNIKLNKFQYHPFHLVENSPWPILVSFSLLSLTTGAVMYLQGYPNGGLLLTLGLILTASGMGLWFRDVITEGTYEGHHTKQVQKGLIIGLVLFIISEVFAFFSVFWAFFHSSLSPAIEIGGVWPPLGITPLDPFSIPLLNTFLLLSSGAFVTWSHHSLILGDRKSAITGALICVILALVFTALQGVEYYETSFTIADSVFGTLFFASTGLHGLHVIIGTIFLIVGLIRIVNYHLTDTHHIGYESSILYWHMVDVVWLFLYIAVYYWGGESIIDSSISNSTALISLSPSNLIKNKTTSKLNPNWISGIYDGDGTFSFSISKNPYGSLGWRVLISCGLVAKSTDANLKMFIEINNYFGNIGLINKEESKNVYRLRFIGFANCLKVKDHFDNYPLFTYKLVHYQLWSKVLDIITSNKHLTMEGLTEIVRLKQHSPKGISKSLASHFTDIESILCPKYSPNFSKITVDWLAGFINADGHFGLRFRKLVSKLSETCCGEIVIVQHNISLPVLFEIVKLLGVGKIYHRKSQAVSIIKISKLIDINLFINKLAQSYFLGSKALDYTDFVRGISLINNKAHITEEGLKELKSLSKGMNKNRSNNSFGIFTYLCSPSPE
jgi:cytochrome c oxidase subunit 3